MDMTLKEAQKIMKRACTFENHQRDKCEECPLYEVGCMRDVNFVEYNVEWLQQELTTWAKANPIRTNLDVQKEKIQGMSANDFQDRVWIDELPNNILESDGVKVISWLNTAVEEESEVNDG